MVVITKAILLRRRKDPLSAPLAFPFHLLSIPELQIHVNNCQQHSLLIIDAQKRIVASSPGFRRVFGFRENIISGLSTDDIFSLGQTAPVLTHVYMETNQKGPHKPVSLILKNHRGEEIACEYSALFLKSMHDASSYYLFYLHRMNPSMDLSLLQQFAGSFMQDINLGVILVDTAFKLVDISDMACRVLGWEKTNILGKTMDKVFASVPEEHRLFNRSILDGMVVRNHAVSWIHNQERYELLLDSNLLKDKAGLVMGAYVIFKDVTNLRSLEEQVKRSDRLAMIGQIAAGTAHEIRNPLTSIKGFMQVLKNTFIEKGMTKEQNYTEIMLTEINRINELVSEFLLLGKRKNARFHQVDILMVLKEILPIIHNEAILHGVNVQYESSAGLPKVIADVELLKQVFLNISKNGIEAMVEGGTLTIVEKYDSEDRKVLVEIHDTGPGIPNFLVDKIFDPFFTTKESGTGLGLSVCQRIVHDMGGSIRVGSKGFGTTFTVCIPVP
jgi:two-component system, sporulation sensor kinase E